MTYQNWANFTAEYIVEHANAATIGAFLHYTTVFGPANGYWPPPATSDKVKALWLAKYPDKKFSTQVRVPVQVVVPDQKGLLPMSS